MKHPTIDIRYGKFLDSIFRAYTELHSDDYGVTDDVSLGREEILKRVEIQKTAWKSEELKILQGLQGITRLTFVEDSIPVYIVPTFNGAFSDPIVISSLQTTRFVDVLTHELIHRLGDFNVENINIRERAKSLFLNTEDVERDHIFVHAIHKFIYLDVLRDPSRLENDLKSRVDFSAYRQAWAKVEELGYQKIIQMFQKISN